MPLRIEIRGDISLQPVLIRSAKGAKCNNLGQRPRLTTSKAISAESAKLLAMKFDYALSALGLIESPNPGRCSGLLHCPPSVLFK
jgi:hypothetical protein